MLVTLALSRVRQEDSRDFEVSLGCVANMRPAGTI